MADLRLVNDDNSDLEIKYRLDPKFRDFIKMTGKEVILDVTNVDGSISETVHVRTNSGDGLQVSFDDVISSISHKIVDGKVHEYVLSNIMLLPQGTVGIQGQPTVSRIRLRRPQVE